MLHVSVEVDSHFFEGRFFLLLRRAVANLYNADHPNRSITFQGAVIERTRDSVCCLHRDWRHAPCILGPCIHFTSEYSAWRQGLHI